MAGHTPLNTYIKTHSIPLIHKHLKGPFNFINVFRPITYRYSKKFQNFYSLMNNVIYSFPGFYPFLIFSQHQIHTSSLPHGGNVDIENNQQFPLDRG